MRIIISLAFVCVCFLSCQDQPVKVSGSFDLTGFESKEINGSSTSYVLKNSPEGNLLADGMIKDGLQDGTWVTYWQEKDDVNKVKTIINYVAGRMNGPYMEFNNRGQIEKRATYVNDKFHGLYSEYKFGRPMKEYLYNDGILDGISKEYSDRGTLAKETSYKNGKLHGSYKQYDEEGKIVLEYEYKNGEKISGGIVGQE